jgi:hypothetical protein
LTGFIWLRVGSSSWLLWTRWWNFYFHKRREISLLAKWPSASQEGLCKAEEELKLYAFFTLALAVGEGSASSSGCFYPREAAAGISPIKGCVPEPLSTWWRWGKSSFLPWIEPWSFKSQSSVCLFICPCLLLENVTLK